MEKEIGYRLKNGIEIYTYKNPSLHSFYISLFVKAGSMYEEESENGITHFLEHTVIRNVNKLFDGELYSILDRNGIEFNASTYSEMVQFYVCGATESFSVGADVISRALCPIILDSDELRAERDRIKAEIRESDDKTSLAAFASGIVHEGTSLSRPILGTLGGVSKITAKRLENYRKRVFTSDNLFFYVTGNFSDEDIRTLSEQIEICEFFSGEKHDNFAPVPEKFGKREETVHIKNADFTMVRFNFDMDMTRLSVPVTDLLYDILLSGYNSRFFIEMSEKRGLFYDLTGSLERYNNIGTFTFSYEVRPDALYSAVEMTLSILSEIKEKLSCEDECMKAGYVKNAYMLYDDPRELNFTFAYDNHVTSNGYSSLSERSESYRKVTPEDIRNTARTIFKRENLTLTVKGNKKKIDVGQINQLLAEWC